MSQIELEKIADHFDRDKDGYIDLSEISSILRGLRRARSLAKKQPISDTLVSCIKGCVILMSALIFMNFERLINTVLSCGHCV